MVFYGQYWLVCIVCSDASCDRLLFEGGWDLDGGRVIHTISFSCVIIVVYCIIVNCIYVSF